MVQIIVVCQNATEEIFVMVYFLIFIHAVVVKSFFWLLTGFELTKQSLDDVAQLSGVMNFGNDYLPEVVRQECERVVPELDNVKPQDAATTFIFLKSYYNNANEVDS